MRSAMAVGGGSGFFWILTGKFSCVPCALAWQNWATGQGRRLGFLGVQIGEPSARMPLPKRRCSFFEASWGAWVLMSGFDLGRASAMVKRRVMTRSTLPSTTVAGWLKAVAAMTAAV